VLKKKVVLKKIVVMSLKKANQEIAANSKITPFEKRVFLFI
jgi:hypothetical protein